MTTKENYGESYNFFLQLGYKKISHSRFSLIVVEAFSLLSFE